MEQQVGLNDIQRLCNGFRNMYHGQNSNVVDSPKTKTTTDATVSNLHKITEKDVNFIEKELDFYEKVSLIFLLYDNSEEALRLFYDENQDFLKNWVQQEKLNNSHNWQNKVLEALTIIKNYSILRELGYDKKELIARFLPNNFSSSLYVHHVKKVLYIACESMNNSDTSCFLQNLRKDFENNCIPFQNFPEKYLELYFLYCFFVKYISLNDISRIVKILKVINLEAISHILSSVSNSRTELISRDNVRETFYVPNGESDRLNNSNSLASSCLLPAYHMDPKNPGICLIINQEHFKIIEDQFQVPIYLKNKPLLTRHGTNHDQQRLKSTFEYFGFRIKIYNNLSHKEILTKIEETLKNITSSDCCFITCILSHGEIDQVYGSDCVPLKISDIKDAIQDRQYKNLLNKPKVLIIQSCQGDQLQEAVDLSKHNTTDGPSKIITTVTLNHPLKVNVIDVPKIIPEKCDLLVCTSTISGYASIRNEIEGSWYIQELCSVLKEEAHKTHMSDLLTLVNNRISQRVWHKEGKSTCMMPCIESSLRKYLYLIPLTQ